MPEPSHELVLKKEAEEEEAAETLDSDDDHKEPTHQLSIKQESLKVVIKEESNSSCDSASSMPLKKRKHLWASEQPSPAKVVKEERDSCSSYSFQSSGGLKFVIRNSPSPCPVRNADYNMDFTKPEKYGDDSDTSGADASSVKQEVISDDEGDNDDTGIYENKEVDRTSKSFHLLSDEVKHKLGDPDESGSCSETLRPPPMSTGVVQESLDTTNMSEDLVSDISYVSSQTDQSEADTAVAGLLSSSEWQVEDDATAVQASTSYHGNISQSITDTSASDIDLMRDLDSGDMYQTQLSRVQQAQTLLQGELNAGMYTQPTSDPCLAVQTTSVIYAQQTSKSGTYTQPVLDSCTRMYTQSTSDPSMHMQQSMSRLQQVQGLLQPNQGDDDQYIQQMNRLQQAQGLLQAGQGDDISFFGSADMFSDPESPGGLNGEMENAINSILSLQQGSSFSDDPMDESYATSMDMDLTHDTSVEEGDDLEAAVNSILM